MSFANLPNGPVARPSKKSRTTLVVILVASAMVILCGCGVLGVALSGDSKPRAGHATSQPAATATTAGSQAAAVVATTAAKPVTPTVTDGTWTVGEDIPAGNYKVIGAGDRCYWSITKSGTNGRDIIDNAIGGGNLRVTLNAGQDFETKRCGTWAKV